MTAFPPVPADDWWRDGDETVVFTSQTPEYGQKAPGRQIDANDAPESLRKCQNDPKTEDTP